MLSKKKVLEDRVNRSLGILKSARIITSRETIELLSMVRWEVTWAWLKILTGARLMSFYYYPTAHLQKLENVKLSSDQGI